ELIEIMESLVQEGKSIILITHKLKEIMQICDRCTVIRKGVGIGTLDVKETTVDELAALMVGRSVSFKTEKSPNHPGNTVEKVENGHVKGERRVTVVRGISVAVREDEIVGLAGVDENGHTELIEESAGLRKPESVAFILNIESTTNLSPRQSTERG